MITKHTHDSAYSENNVVSLYRSGKPFFDLLLQLINEARHCIQLQTYILEEDETGKIISEALKKAASRGVKISLLVDGYASQNLSSGFIKSLTRSGIKFRKFEPILRSKKLYFGRRLHHKLLVVDTYNAVVTGINISNKYNDFAGTTGWLDWAVYVRGEIAEQLDTICTKLYYKNAERLTFGRAKFDFSERAGNTKVRIRRNDWVNRYMEITESYVEMFKTAKDYIYLMSPYFLPGHILQKAIAEAADRGVRIKLILPGISDVQMAKLAERYMYRWLLKFKTVDIYEYQPKVLHGKMATYDGVWVTVGSYNVNNISAYASVELNLDINDKHFANETETKLERIIKLDCIKVDEKYYLQKTNFFKLFIQRSCYEIIKIMLYLFTFYFKQRE